MKRLGSLFMTILLMLCCPLAFAEASSETGLSAETAENSAIPEEEITEIPQDSEAEEALFSEPSVQVSDEWWNILLLGGDSRSTKSYERTDSIIIFSINKEDSRIKMTSIMRDTLVSLPDHHGTHKINAADVFVGPELTVKAVNEYYGTNIEHYILINMTDLIDIIDMLGGVDIEVTSSERHWINHYAQLYERETKRYDGEDRLSETGLVHLNGLLALAHSRNRYSDSDFGRVVRQRDVLLALAQKIQNTDFNDLLDMAGQIADRVQTNLDNDLLEELITAALSAEIGDVEQLTLPVEGTYSVVNGSVWAIKPDFEENARLLREFIYG